MEAFEQSVNSMKTSTVELRQQYREYQLAAVIKKEVEAAFSSKALKRRFCLGVASLDVDLDLLGSQCIPALTKSNESPNIPLHL